MGIIKNTNSKLNIQLRAQYPVDRVSKSTFCLSYAVDEADTTPGKGKLSLGPISKPEATTVLRISHTALMGADMKKYLNFTTEGSIMLYFKPNADNFASFKISQATDLGSATEFTISEVLSSDAYSVLNPNDQVCVVLNPAPTSEALTTVDGGYY